MVYVYVYTSIAAETSRHAKDMPPCIHGKTAGRPVAPSSGLAGQSVLIRQTYSLPVGVLSCDIQVELSSTTLEVVHTIASRFVMRSRGHTETTRENSPSPWREQTPAVL